MATSRYLLAMLSYDFLRRFPFRCHLESEFGLSFKWNKWTYCVLDAPHNAIKLHILSYMWIRIDSLSFISSARIHLRLCHLIILSIFHLTHIVDHTGQVTDKQYNSNTKFKQKQCKKQASNSRHLALPGMHHHGGMSHMQKHGQFVAQNDFCWSKQKGWFLTSRISHGKLLQPFRDGALGL